MVAMLSKVGTIVSAGLDDPTNGEAFNQRVKAGFEAIWQHVTDFVVREFTDGHILEGKHFRRSLNLTWEQTRKFWLMGSPCPQPYSWLRSRVLYVLMPADRTMPPTVLYVLALSLLPLMGTRVIAYLLLFLFIDKKDEYQLIHFITLFKTAQFVCFGVIPGIEQAIEHFHCLVQIHSGAPTGCIGMNMLVQGEMALEPLRMAIQWYAFWLLASGSAFGGKRAMEALETSRIDWADGVLDGTCDSAQLGTDGKHERVPFEMADHATQAARIGMGAERRVGGCFGYFMLWDGLMTLLFICVSVAIIWIGGYQWGDWILWEVFEMARMLQALSTFPFLIFIVPCSIEILTGACPTGYDRAGALRNRLSATQIKKLERRRERHLDQLRQRKG